MTIDEIEDAVEVLSTAAGIPINFAYVPAYDRVGVTVVGETFYFTPRIRDDPAYFDRIWERLEDTIKAEVDKLARTG